MTCQEIQEELYDFAFGLLEENEGSRIESHLQTCLECRKAHERVKAEHNLLKQWTTPPPPPGLAEKVIAAAEKAPRGEAARKKSYTPVEPELRWLGGQRFWQVALAACLLLAVGLAVQTYRVVSRHADPQEAFLYGPNELTPGLPASYRVFVRNGQYAFPVRNAKIQFRLVSNTGQTLSRVEAATDDDGMAQIEPKVPAAAGEGDFKLEVLASSDHGRSEITRTVTVKRSFRVMVSTDKPLYQPGQLIHVRSLSLATADLRPVSGKNAIIEVKDPKGNKVFKKTQATSDYGVASADFELADQVNLGAYTVSVTIGDTASERTVQVERYTLPKFKIDLTADKGFYQPGETVKGHLSARYTFGQPVAGGRVRVVASEFIEKLRPFAQAEGETDKEGNFQFEIPLKESFVGQELKKGDALVSLEATVLDPADHTQKKTLDLTVTQRLMRIELFPESGSLVQGVENILYIMTAYPDGRPAKTKLLLGATQETTQTSDVGLAKVKINPTQPELQLTVTAEDEKGLRITESLKLNMEQRSDAFLLRTDRAVYSAGQTVAVTVLSAERTGRVFLDVVKDRRTMLMSAVDVKDGEGSLALDLPPDLFGTLELHAYRILSDGNIVSDTRIIQVNRTDDLVIQAELDKETYRPAEKALLRFLVKRSNGESVPAALGLSGVDEAVFALQEMRPGLERVYFALQEEILKPRYEIHAHPPVSIQDAVLPHPEGKPELQEATVVLFSMAQGTESKPPQASTPFEQKQRILRKEKHRHFYSIGAVGVTAPFVLFALLVMPIFGYATWRLFKPSHFLGLTDTEQYTVNDSTDNIHGWWLIGFLAWGLLAILGPPMLVLVGPFTILVSCKLLSWVKRLQRIPLMGALPLLGKALSCLPAAYVCLIVGTVLWFAGKVARPAISANDLMLLVVTGLLVAGVAGCIPFIRNCILRQVSVEPWLWRAARWSLYLGLPILFLVALTVPALQRAQARATLQLAGNSQLAGDTEFFSKPIRSSREDTTGEPNLSGTKAMKAPTRIRRYFPETLLWMPELITNESGRAELEVPLADSITTWRIAMSAVSHRGELGAATKALRVFQDFFVDIDFPVSLTQHDQVSVPVAVFNYLDKPQTVRLEVQPESWVRMLDSPTRTLEIGPGQVTSVYFRLEAQTPGHHSLTVKAFGTELADAVERKVIVEPDGKEFVQTVNGELSEILTQEVVIPEDAIDGASDLLVKIYPSAFSQVIEGLENIFRMPSGCFEQTSSTTYPNVLALDYMRRTRQIQPEVEMKALNFVNLGYQRLLSYEVPGGGFEWFGHPPAHSVLTAYGLMEFNDMAKVYEVDAAVLRRTREWLYSQQQGDGSWAQTQSHIVEGATNQFQGAALRTTAYIAWALAESGEAESRLGRALDFITRSGASSDDAYTVALCANAFVAAKRPEASDFLTGLDSLKQAEEKHVRWTSAAQGVTFSRGNTLDIETTALAAYAFLKSGRFTDSANRALAWLITQKDSWGTWHSTQSTIHTMRALLSGTGDSSSVEGEMHVALAANGQWAKELAITPETSEVFHLISLRHLVSKGKNTIALETAGKGKLAYQIVARHYLPWPEKPAEESKEMSIEVAYETTTLKKDDLLTCNVVVRYNRPGSAPMTIVDLGIPPGFEALADAFETLKEQRIIERYSLTGRQVILYFREIPGGKPVKFSYQLRAKFPVKAKTPRSVVYQYYEPEVRAEAMPVELKVL